MLKMSWLMVPILLIASTFHARDIKSATATIEKLLAGKK